MTYINKTGLDGKEAYLGFMFGGVHSSELQVIRIIENRIEEELTVPREAKIMQIPGGNKGLFYGLNWMVKEVSVRIAYDNMSELSRRKMAQLLIPNKLQKLTFDEKPHITYWAKVSDSPQLTYVPFDDDELGRVYKGEGTINFIIPDPLGFTDAEVMRAYDDMDNPWFSTIGWELDSTDWNLSSSGGTKRVKNTGIAEADYKIYIKAKKSGTKMATFTIKTGNGSTLFNPTTSITEIKTGQIVCIDSRLNLTYLVDRNFKSRNKALSGVITSTLPKIPTGISNVELLSFSTSDWEIMKKDDKPIDIIVKHY